MTFNRYMPMFVLASSLMAAPPPQQFERLSHQADSARDQNKIEDAIDLYRQALKLRPSWKAGWWSLGTILYDLDRYPEARDAFRELIALDPKGGRGFALLGLSEFQTQDYEPALVHLGEASRLGVGDNQQMAGVVLYHYALLLNHFEQFELAAKVLEGLVRQGNTSPAIVEAAGLSALRKPLFPGELPPQDRELVSKVGRAAVALAEARAAEAEKQFSELAAAYPTSPNLHYLYGLILLSKDPDQGLRELQKELDLNPKHLPVLVSVAMEYQKRGDAASSIPYAERAVAVDPKSFVAHLVLGKALSESGDLNRGIPELELSVQLAPDSPQARIALASAYAKAGRSKEAAVQRQEFLKLKKLGEDAPGK